MKECFSREVGRDTTDNYRQEITKVASDIISFRKKCIKTRYLVSNRLFMKIYEIQSVHYKLAKAHF